jgi:hypothetical protein
VTDIANIASSIAAHLAEDEAAAKEAARDECAEWRRSYPNPGMYTGTTDITDVTLTIVARVGTPVAGHIARQDPARTLRRVKATRDLVAVILSEPHDWNVEDEFYSCSQAVQWPDPGEPGSGCSDPERAGKPCDCGRDARVTRLLSIIASEWEASLWRCVRPARVMRPLLRHGNAGLN